MLREKWLSQGDTESPDVNPGPIELRLFVLITAYAKNKELKLRFGV